MKRKNETHKSTFKYEGSECPVCMEEMRPESRSVTSPCMHEFCLECIGKWLTESSSNLCPLCKQSVKLIIYNIRTATKYSKINFPKSFNGAWSMRNKTKRLLDNFENIIQKIYSTIRTFMYNKKDEFEEKILHHLIYFGYVGHRLKSRSSNDIVLPLEIPDNEVCWTLVEKMIHQRLLLFFSHSQSAKIIKEITDKRFVTFSKILTVLEKYIDPARFRIFKSEIITFIQMSRDFSAYTEYYVAAKYEHVIFTKETLMDECITAALITRIISTVSVDMSKMAVTVCQINNIDHISTWLDSLLSYEKILLHLSFSSYYILLSTNFYSTNSLQKRIDFNSCPIPAFTCELIKHCFHVDEFNQINHILSKFEDRLIFFEPLIVDDSNMSLSIPDSPDSYIDSPDSNIVIELSDSDDDDDNDDGIEIISYDPPVLDLTESVSSDDDIAFISFPQFSDSIPIKKPRVFSTESDSNGLPDLSLSATSNLEPTTSSGVIVDSSIDRTASHSANSGEISDNLRQPIDCSSESVSSLGDEEVIEKYADKETEKAVDFIYQPRSVNDFYEYLMAKNNLPDN